MVQERLGFAATFPQDVSTVPGRVPERFRTDQGPRCARSCQRNGRKRSGTGCWISMRASTRRCSRPPRACASSMSATPPSWTASMSVSYTHLRAHETDSYLVCRLLLENKKLHDQQHLLAE